MKTPTRHRVTLIPGDGIGPELMHAARRVIESTGVAFDWDEQPAGADCVATEGTPLPKRVLDSLRSTRVGWKGPITTPVGGGFRSVNVTLRTELDLYANLRPAKSYAGIPNAIPGVDIVVVRENTEDLYVGLEFEPGDPALAKIRELTLASCGRTFREDSALSLKPISTAGSRRIVEFAFDYARSHRRRKVTAVHKANIMKVSDGLFLAVARAVAAERPDVPLEEAIVDALCMRLVQQPKSFDVLVLPNLYGDIVSDLCAALIGGLGVAPGANYGAEAALFEPVHGSAPQFKGSGRMNPTALLLTGVLMLRHLGEEEAANRLESAIARVLAAGTHVTADLLPPESQGRAASTEEMADAIVAELERLEAVGGVATTGRAAARAGGAH